MYHGQKPYQQRVNPDVLTQLARMQKVLGDAVGPPEELGDYRRDCLGDADDQQQIDSNWAIFGDDERPSAASRRVDSWFRWWGGLRGSNP